MRRDVLNRYERTDDGRIVIDVAAERAEDLYNHFDRTAPYVRRDLDQDLVDYLLACAKEIGRRPYTIRFTFEHPPADATLARVRQSVQAFFLYLVAGQRQKIRQMFHRSAILFAIGLAIFFVSVRVNKIIAAEHAVAWHVAAEGITVAAWVALWESIAIFLIEWLPSRRVIRTLHNMAAAEVSFRAARDAPLPTSTTSSGGY